MSKTLEENWEVLSREHEMFMQDLEYIKWLKWVNQQPPLTLQEQKTMGHYSSERSGWALAIAIIALIVALIALIK